MDFSPSTQGMFGNISVSFWLVGAIVIILVFFGARLFTSIPQYSAQFNLLTPTTEGFQGVQFGSGDPPCLRDLDTAAKALEILSKRCDGSNEADLREFALLLGKLACLKKDLMSPSGIVLNTRHLQYETAHDREPVAEVAAQCLGRTMPARDLDIIFDTYKTRGFELIRKLSISLNLSEEDTKLVEKNFSEAWIDVYDVSKSRCLATTQNGAGEYSPKIPAAYLPPSLDYLKAYQGYY